MAFQATSKKLLKYFNKTAIVGNIRIEWFLSAAVFSIILALYSKDLKASLFAIVALKLFASSLEQTHILPAVLK